MAGLGMDMRPTEGTSARSDQGGPGSARPEGPEVVLTAPHLAGDMGIVREIVGKLDECTLGMGGALFSAEGGCALRRGSRQARRSCWAAGSRPRCPRAPRPWRRTRGLLRIRCSACGDAAFSSPLRRPCGVLFCSSKPSAHFPLAGVRGWRGTQRPPAVPGPRVEHLSPSLMLAPGWTKRF